MTRSRPKLFNLSAGGLSEGDCPKSTRQWAKTSILMMTIWVSHWNQIRPDKKHATTSFPSWDKLHMHVGEFQDTAALRLTDDNARICCLDLWDLFCCLESPHGAYAPSRIQVEYAFSSATEREVWWSSRDLAYILHTDRVISVKDICLPWSLMIQNGTRYMLDAWVLARS